MRLRGELPGPNSTKYELLAKYFNWQNEEIKTKVQLMSQESFGVQGIVMEFRSAQCH